jgi:predicted O-linked N-acetylglucosamine transferase (SPINDLY family)
LCTQNLRKYHPDFDHLLGQLLRHDPTGWVCVIEDAQPLISKLLKERFQRQLPDVAQRIVFLPRQTRADYLHLVSLADIVLDTLYYGGGANSLYDAFACGTPLVTLPGPFHRSRFALGAYCKMGIPDLIAESVKRARLAT